jgi:outer membrane lipoprotein SlyB
MFKKLALSTAVAVSALTAIPAAAEAQSRHGYYDARHNGYNNQYRRYDRRYDRRYANQRYRNQRYGNYYGNRCRRDDGTTGTILGAIAGGLLGREIAGRGDRTVGTIIGGAAGALAGRAIDRSDSCRR